MSLRNLLRMLSILSNLTMLRIILSLYKCAHHESMLVEITIYSISHSKIKIKTVVLSKYWTKRSKTFRAPRPNNGKRDLKKYKPVTGSL